MSCTHNCRQGRDCTCAPDEERSDALDLILDAATLAAVLLMVMLLVAAVCWLVMAALGR
ncbi:MAG: hypothetical protein N2690_03395 [Rhodocyclaceae bacterium]|nr:hypothetical protein [Rhodocyclaceae bacterium]